MQYLKASNIATGVHYRPNHHYDMYEGARGETVVADKVWKRILTLPLFPDLTFAQQDRIIEVIKRFFLA